jgi:hypothetical protein
MAQGQGTGFGPGGPPEPTSETLNLAPESMFGVSESGFGLSVAGAYDPGITPEIDRKIRNMPMVVEYINAKAHELLSAVGSDNFEVILSHKPDQQRPRAYVCPSNNKGIHEELSEAILLKAALGMAGR